MCLSSCRDQEQVPLYMVDLVLQAPDPHDSASRVSISGTCSSVWRMRDLPVAPISSTRAFSNRLDVREERKMRRRGRREGWGTVKCEITSTTESIRTFGSEEEDLAHFKVFTYT